MTELKDTNEAVEQTTLTYEQKKRIEAYERKSAELAARKEEELPIPSWKPMSDRVLVYLDPQEEKKGLIYIASDTKGKTGRVAAKGPGKLLDNGTIETIELEIGQRVILGNYGQEVTLEGKVYQLVKDSDILAVIEG